MQNKDFNIKLDITELHFFIKENISRIILEKLEKENKIVNYNFININTEVNKLFNGMCTYLLNELGVIIPDDSLIKEPDIKLFLEDYRKNFFNSITNGINNEKIDSFVFFKSIIEEDTVREKITQNLIFIRNKK